MKIINEAIRRNQYSLSEYESKRILEAYGIPVTEEALVDHTRGLLRAADKIGYPIAIKACSDDISHKTEAGLVYLDIRNETEALAAYNELMNRMEGDHKQVIVQQMVKGQRELMAGMIRDPQFGPCVMFGLGGIFAEVLNDAAFRVAPLEEKDGLEMMAEIKGRKILEHIRGMEPADKNGLARILVSLGQIGLENERIREIDINPVIIAGGKPVAVDALVILERD